MSICYIRVIAGVIVQKQPEGEPGFIEASDEVCCGMIEDGAGGYIVPEPKPAPEIALSLQQVAAARLVIDGFDITGIERSQGIGFAMMLDENTAWIFFNDPQADTNYIVTPGDGVSKSEEYFEVICPGVVNLALIVQRVQ